MNSLNSLASPLSTSKVSFANRVVIAPMARDYAPNFVPDEKLASYYASARNMALR